ncbi:NlpC/P60 family protein [Streptomyces sp. HUCO-GS316]|uniref:NlpC/P60 family protein n=1 Tax=Streptomyces sp. HUCO-GS316 TaxID=2692198 RepID=UPI001F1BABDC|nr:NlpC/P60 family protein [Streptomyces sp. HUCO-GS316]
MAPERTSRPKGLGLPGMRNSALATAALTSVALFSQTADAAAGDDGPSRDEVQQRVNTLYDQAETATGNYNATRAMSTGTRRAVGTAAKGSGGSDPALDEVAKQWFDVARSRFGPTVPAVLPPDRTPTPAPRSGSAERQAVLTELTAERVPADVRELPAGAASRPVLELTAGPSSASASLPALPALPAAPEAGGRAPLALPALAAGDQRASLRTSKEQSLLKLAAARELLSRHAAQQTAPVAALEAAPGNGTWLGTPEPARPAAAEEAWPQQPANVALPQQQLAEPGAWTEQRVAETAAWPQQQLAEPGAQTQQQATETVGWPQQQATETAAWPQQQAETMPWPQQQPADSGAWPLQTGEAAWQQQQPFPGPAATPDGPGTPAGAVGTVSAADPVNGPKAERALDFARAQTGRPCVMGATGPDSYDCASLTQAAWKAAGVALPRSAPDQANAGTVIPLSSVQPGDLLFFHDDLTHVGLYTGDGLMIHAPGPGRYIREESVHSVGESAIRGAVRLA